MASINYDRFANEEIVAAEDEVASSISSDDGQDEGEGYTYTRIDRMHDMLTNKWPQKVGILHLLFGILLILIGLAQLFIVPIFEPGTKDGWNPHLGHQNVFGVALWAGIMLALSGSLGVRAAIHHSVSALYYFMTVILVEVLLFLGMVILILVGYSSHWTTQDAYPTGSILFPLHVVATVCIMLGSVLVVFAFTQYYEDVFCGELQLCKRFVHCCLPCWCPQAIQEQQLLDEDAPGRPPSLPV